MKSDNQTYEADSLALSKRHSYAVLLTVARVMIIFGMAGLCFFLFWYDTTAESAGAPTEYILSIADRQVGIVSSLAAIVIGIVIEMACFVCRQIRSSH